MDNISVFCDDCYVREAISSILKGIKRNALNSSELSVFLFEKTWLNETELSMILNCQSERIIIFARESLLGFFSSLMLPEHISFGRYDMPINNLRKIMDDFINPPVKEFLVLRRKVIPEKKLSPSERKITSLYVQGLSVVHIAKSMNKSFKTVSSHKRSAMKKMGISSNMELMQKGRVFLMMNREYLLAS